LVLNENNRNEITHFHGKTIEEFIEIKRNLQPCKDLETIVFAEEALTLIDKNGIDVFFQSTFQIILIAFNKGNSILRIKCFMSLMILQSIKRQRPRDYRKSNS
jgi:hypothetical protein